MGDFAQQSLPLVDSVTLTVLPVGSEHSETITVSGTFRLYPVHFTIELCVTNQVPYRSRFGSMSVPFTDGPSLQAGNCVAQPGTNGVDANAPTSQTIISSTGASRFQPPLVSADRKRTLNMAVNEAPVADITLPPGLAPTGNISGSGAIQFFELDSETGVLALGSFASGTFDGMEQTLLSGLQQLKSDGKTRLVVDLVC